MSTRGVVVEEIDDEGGREKEKEKKSRRGDFM